MPDSLLQESLFPALFASLPPIVSLRGDSPLITPIALNNRLKFLKDTDRNLMKALRDAMADSNLSINDSTDAFMKLLDELTSRGCDAALLDYVNWYWELRVKLAEIRSRIHALDIDTKLTKAEFKQSRGSGGFITSLTKDRVQSIEILENELSEGRIDKATIQLLEMSWKRLLIYVEHEVSDLSRFGFYIIRWQLAREARMSDSQQAIEYLDWTSDLILDDHHSSFKGVHRG